MPKLIKSDPTAAEWFDCPEVGFDEDSGKAVRLRVRSSFYPPFRLELQQTMMRLRRQYPGEEPIPPRIVDRENGRLYAKHLLVDWENVDDDGGKPLPFDAAIAAELAMDAEHARFRDAIFDCARIVGQRRNDQTKTIAGNLPPASDGS